MKYCEHCKTNYPDTVNFCTICGKMLVPAPEVVQDGNGGSVQPPRKKGRSILKVFLITLAVLVIGFFMLVNHLSNAATYLRVEPNVLVADKSGGEIVVDIDYDGYIWAINHVPDWIEVEEYEQSFKVKAGANHTGYSREGSITVQSGDFLAQVVIEQKAYATYIKASKTSIRFDEDGGSETVTISTDGCGYEIEHSDFLSVTSDDDKIEIEADSNSDEYRNGYVTLSEDNVRTRISIIQGGDCNNCHGSGSRTCYYCNGMGGWYNFTSYASCWNCGGTGTIECAMCSGSGKRK